MLFRSSIYLDHPNPYYLFRASQPLDTFLYHPNLLLLHFYIMVSPKLVTVAGRSSTKNTAADDKKNKQYLRISPLHRHVLVASYKRAKRAAAPPRRNPSLSSKTTPTSISFEKFMKDSVVRQIRMMLVV